MFSRFINKFGTTLYVQIWENRIRVVDIDSNKVFDEQPLLQFNTLKNGKMDVVAFGNQAYVDAVNPFSHPRALLADFFIAELLLKQIMQKLSGKKFTISAPVVIVHPMEKTEGGLTMIEIRALREMALGAGARDVAVYQGENTLAASTIVFKDIALQEVTAAAASSPM